MKNTDNTDNDFDMFLELIDAELAELELDIVLYDEMQNNLDALKQEEISAMNLIKQRTPQALQELGEKVQNLVDD